MMLRAVAVRQPFKRAGKFAAQRIGLVELPVVEAGAIAQAEARQEIILVERNGLRQWLDAGGAALDRRVSVSAALRQQSAKLMHINPDVGAEVQAQCFPF